MTFTFGSRFKIQVFGESHGECIGVIVEGVPPGLLVDISKIQLELDRRRPGVGNLVSTRFERDQVSIQSGVFIGKANGAPIKMMIPNTDVDSTQYEEMRHTPRPGHADYTARVKYKENHDYRGGGFFSGRMTAAFVMAGALAKQILQERGIETFAHTIQIGKVKSSQRTTLEDLKQSVYDNPVRCAEQSLIPKMTDEISNAKDEGDSVGGIIECQIHGVPVGVGEPIFDSIESVISHAMFSIPAVKGVEFGSGFSGSSKRGSENNDSLEVVNGEINWTKNDAGGILGGITNGAPIIFRVALKPTPSIAMQQNTVDLEKMENTTIEIKGRHDPCIVPRAVPVVEAMAAVVIVDLLMRFSPEF